MKRLIIILLVLMVSGLAMAADETKRPSTLIGVSGGGQYFITTKQSAFFGQISYQTLLASFLGLEFNIGGETVPTTKYGVNTVPAATYSGSGQVNYMEVDGGVQFVLGNVAIVLGLSYNNFMNGYLPVAAGVFSLPVFSYNFFSVYAGPELTTKLFGDFYAQIGVKAVYDFSPDNYVSNPAMGVRLILSIMYGA